MHYLPDTSLFALVTWLIITCNVIITFYQLKANIFLVINDHIAAGKRKWNLNTYEYYIQKKKNHTFVTSTVFCIENGLHHNSADYHPVSRVQNMGGLCQFRC
jgi:hypothetical protein